MQLPHLLQLPLQLPHLLQLPPFQFKPVRVLAAVVLLLPQVAHLPPRWVIESRCTN